jgi:hypothetical protein
MREYTLEDAIIQLPQECRVACIVTAAPERGETFASNLVVTRDRFKEDEDWNAYVDRQLIELARGLKRFKLHGRRDVAIDGVEGVELACGSFGNNGPIEQRVTLVPRAGGSVMTFTATATKARAKILLPMFEAIVQSTRFPSKAE